MVTGRRTLSPYCNVRPIPADAVAAPLVPTIETVPAPATAEVDAVIVAMALAPGLTLTGLKVIDTPAGAVAFKATGLMNPVDAVTATERVVDLPRRRVNEVDAGVMVRIGATTATEDAAVAEARPLTPLIVMVPAPAVAVVDAEIVAVAVDPGFTLAGLKATVTPAGAVADRAMELV